MRRAEWASRDAGHRACSARRAVGFTLLELVTSLAVMTIVMGGMGSAIYVASKAVAPDSTAAQMMRSGRVLDELSEELSCAIWVRELGDHTVMFTVADRDDDGSPERIRYAWSGTAGDPLTREYNDGDAVTVLADVHDFALAYERETLSEEYPGPLVESDETELFSHDTSANLGTAEVRWDRRWGQYFKPTLSDDVAGWSVTRVKFVAKRHDNGDDHTLIQLVWPNEAGLPGDRVVDEIVMAQLSLSSGYQWVEYSFANAAGLPPGKGLYLTFSTQDWDSAKLQYRQDYAVLADATLVEGRPNWEDPDPEEALLFYVYGKTLGPGAPQTATRQYVTGVQIGLQCGEDASAAVRTAVRAMNTPEVLSAMWESDFDVDPTTSDANGDGELDWADDGGTYDPGSVSGGIWYADSKLVTYPSNDLDELITAVVRFRGTTVGSDCATFRINCDSDGSTFAPVGLKLRLEADETQTLTAFRQPTTGLETVVTVSGLPSRFVTARLVIDPVLDTFSVSVNDEHKGTFYYSRRDISGGPQAFMQANGCGAEFDFVSVRVGGND